MKTLGKLAVTVVSAVAMLIPSFIWFILKNVVNPNGFWENLAVVGLGIWIFGGAQCVFFTWWVLGNVLMWFDVE